MRQRKAANSHNVETGICVFFPLDQLTDESTNCFSSKLQYLKTLWNAMLLKFGFNFSLTLHVSFVPSLSEFP